MAELVSTAKIRNPLSLFSGANVSEKDLERYTKLIEQGKQDEAIDEFIAKYVNPYVESYQITLQDYISQAEKGQLSTEDQNKLEESIGILTVAISTLLTSNFNSFIDVLAPSVFEDNDIVSAKLKKAILEQTLGQFEQLTQGAMLETQTNVLNYVRTLQKEMIIENQLIASQGFVDQALMNEIERFKDSLRAKYPDLYKALDNGQILKSKLDADGNYINYKLDKYSEMSIRTTLLNVDRTAVEVTATIEGAEVVEYYKRDNRTVKEPRIICINILGNKTQGKSLLALTPEAAQKYGIMTLAEARGQGAMGPHCRHSIKRFYAINN